MGVIDTVHGRATDSRHGAEGSAPGEAATARRFGSTAVQPARPARIGFSVRAAARMPETTRWPSPNPICPASLPASSRRKSSRASATPAHGSARPRCTCVTAGSSTTRATPGRRTTSARGARRGWRAGGLRRIPTASNTRCCAPTRRASRAGSAGRPGTRPWISLPASWPTSRTSGVRKRWRSPATTIPTPSSTGPCSGICTAVPTCTRTRRGASRTGVRRASPCSGTSSRCTTSSTRAT